MYTTEPSLSFTIFAAQNLEKLLPYRKKGIFGPQVCEFIAVIPMAKAGFFVGGALGLMNKDDAEFALSNKAGCENWRDAYKGLVNTLQKRVDAINTDTASYEEVFPEEYQISRDSAQQLLNSTECMVQIQERVLRGLLFGVLFPSITSAMMQSWVNQDSKTQDLRVGGLKVRERPLLTSVEQAYAAAKDIYEMWIKS